MTNTAPNQQQAPILKTNNRSGGEILIDGLINYGSDTLFCVPGESYLAALDALYDRQDKIRIITCRQEGGAAYAAEAYGKLTNNPGICFVSRGPGASNAMVGIHTAFQDSTPLLLFIGQVSRIDVGREAFQELDFHKVYGGVAKQVITFNDAARIPEQAIADLPIVLCLGEVFLDVGLGARLHDGKGAVVRWKFTRLPRNAGIDQDESIFRGRYRIRNDRFQIFVVNDFLGVGKILET